MMFADLHCHPALFGFNRLRHGPDDGDPTRFHAWNVPDEVDHRSMAEGKRGATYTQCTLPMLTESKTRIAFASITPIEKGFFFGSHDVAAETRFEVEVLKLLSGASFAAAARHFVSGRRDLAGAAAAGVLRNRGPARRALQRIFMRYDEERVRFMMTDEYDYFEELLREYEYYTNANDRVGSGMLHTPDGPDRVVTGRYQMIRDGQHLRHVIEETDDVAFVMTIEGAHSISVRPDGGIHSREQLGEHIEILRDLEFPFFFITLAHHFDNGLCGHAHSLPDAAHWVMDQSVGMEEGFNDTGRWAARELLALDEHLRPTGRRRMLLDCKHMSPRTRQQYYAEIVQPYNAWARVEGAPVIPVIASHSGYSGVGTLDQLIENQPHEDDNWHRNPYLAWGINHCDEDVRNVFASGGLIGVCFDRRICGVPPRQKVPREMWSEILLRQILGTVDVILQDERIPFEEGLGVWDNICIGSDYDGLIDPVTAYPTALHLPRFADDLASRLNDLRHTRGISEIGVETLVEKICWRNGYELAVEHMA